MQSAATPDDHDTDPRPTLHAVPDLGVELVDPNPCSSYRSPLDPDDDGRYPTALRGGIVTDPAEIRAIRRRVEAGVRADARRGAWRRALRRIRSGR